MTEKDGLRRFLIESTDVRGLLVHLDDTWQNALARVDYPLPVRDVLGQALAASVLLAATIKFDGKLTLQVRGDGPVHLLVIQINADRKVRGLARWRALPQSQSLAAVFGDNARMSMTIEATESGTPYQGIVALEGETLADALGAYFLNSEQLETRLMLAVNDTSAAGMLLQRLPDAGQDNDGWQRSVQLASTLTEQELLSLQPETLLHRLYHQEKVRLFDSDPVVFECSCSRSRCDALVLGLGRQEAEAILSEQGNIDITCEFCDESYQYDAVDVHALYAGAMQDTATNQHH